MLVPICWETAEAQAAAVDHWVSITNKLVTASLTRESSQNNKGLLILIELGFIPCYEALVIVIK